MSNLRYDLAALYDPEIFALGRMPAHSDHDIYRTLRYGELRVELRGYCQ